MKQKIVKLAYRDKKDTLTIKKGSRSFVFLAIISLIVALILLFIPADDGDVGFKIALISLLVGSASFFGAMSGFVYKQKRKIDKENNYDSLAIYFDMGKIYIQKETVMEISISDIVSVNHVGEHPQTKELGKLIIVDKNNNEYIVEQLRDSKFTYKRLISLLNGEYIIVDGIYFMLNNFFSCYTADVEISNDSIEISLYEEGGSLEATIKTIKKIFEDFEQFFNRVLNGSVNDVVTLAKQSHVSEIFSEEFILGQLRENLYTLTVSGDRYSLGFYIDDIFSDLMIHCEGNINEDNYIVSLDD